MFLMAASLKFLTKVVLWTAVDSPEEPFVRKAEHAPSADSDDVIESLTLAVVSTGLCRWTSCIYAGTIELMIHEDKCSSLQCTCISSSHFRQDVLLHSDVHIG